MKANFEILSRFYTLKKHKLHVLLVLWSKLIQLFKIVASQINFFMHK